MQTVPVEHNRVPRSYTADQRADVDHGKTAMSDGGKEIILPPLSRAMRPVAGMSHEMANWTAS